MLSTGVLFMLMGGTMLGLGTALHNVEPYIPIIDWGALTVGAVIFLYGLYLVTTHKRFMEHGKRIVGQITRVVITTDTDVTKQEVRIYCKFAEHKNTISYSFLTATPEEWYVGRPCVAIYGGVLRETVFDDKATEEYKVL